MKLNQAFSALRKSGPITPTPASDGEEEEKVPGPEVLEERLKHCTSVKEHAVSVFSFNPHNQVSVKSNCLVPSVGFLTKLQIYLFTKLDVSLS